MQSDQDICLLLGQLDGKIDQIIRDQIRVEKMIVKSEERINRLERDRAIMYGAAAVLAFIGSGLMWVISHFVKGM
jgi:hypothetical protein|tara:strand:- start:1007 stop:1231 length:225 start_codon:yes stop_codon:yes gene_type:complete